MSKNELKTEGNEELEAVFARRRLKSMENETLTLPRSIEEQKSTPKVYFIV